MSRYISWLKNLELCCFTIAMLNHQLQQQIFLWIYPCNLFWYFDENLWFVLTSDSDIHLGNNPRWQPEPEIQHSPSHVHITWPDFGSCPVKPTMISAVVLSVITMDAQVYWMWSSALMLWFVTPPTMSVCNPLWSAGNVTLAIIIWIINLTYKVKSVQRLDIHEFHSWVPDVPVSCRYLTRWQGTRVIVPAMSAEQQAPLL